jgi:membrane-bound ClpP family serine protease
VEQKKITIPLRVIIKYALLQIPGLVLFCLVLVLSQRWIYFPPLILWSLIFIWVLKDIILFPVVWRSYDTHAKMNSPEMINARGTAMERLAPSGYAHIQGELWKVEVAGENPPVEKGETVQVIGRNNLTLLVKRVIPDQKASPQTEA